MPSKNVLSILKIVVGLGALYLSTVLTDQSAALVATGMGLIGWGTPRLGKDAES